MVGSTTGLDNVLRIFNTCNKLCFTSVKTDALKHVHPYKHTHTYILGSSIPKTPHTHPSIFQAACPHGADIHPFSKSRGETTGIMNALLCMLLHKSILFKYFFIAKNRLMHYNILISDEKYI